MPSSNSMTRGEFPTDLLMEILSRLPSKSIARFRCVSKLWGSMFRSPCFTELFLTRSRACPRLFFVLGNHTEWSFYSAPELQNPQEKVVVAADFHTKMTFSPRMFTEFCEHTSGLIYFSRVCTGKFSLSTIDTVPLVCNPNTGHYAVLPELDISRESFNGFLGFDPIDKQFKLLYMSKPDCFENHKIMTLGTAESGWRTIQCTFKHEALSKGICINGVLYYLAQTSVEMSTYVIVCFDIRSETFKHVDASCCLDHKFINCKGKLGGIGCKYVNTGGRCTLEVSLCVLKDVEKQEWSEHVYKFWDENQFLNVHFVNVAGMTATGEIVFSKRSLCNPFYVYYFSPERNTLQRVEIQGIGEELEFHKTVYAFVDHVEDLNVNDSAIPLQSSHGLNISRERPNLEKTSYCDDFCDDFCNSGSGFDVCFI